MRDTHAHNMQSRVWAMCMLVAWSCSQAADNGTDSEDYVPDYDYEDSLSTYQWSELIPTLVVYGSTLLVGISGNCLIIFTISRYQRMNTTTNVFLASLASADLLLILICIPVKVAKLFSYTWTMGVFLCKGVHYLQSVSAICSVLTLTAMSIERYYAIVHPMRAKYTCTVSQARRITLGIWCASFVLAVPMLVVQVHLEVGVRIQAYWCVPDPDNLLLWRLHEVYMLLLILVVPTGIMGMAYTCICWEVWSVMRRRPCVSVSRNTIPLRSSHRSCKRSGHDRGDEDNSTVKQVIKMLVAVVVLFVLCWAPLLIHNVLKAYHLIPSNEPGTVKHIGTAFHLMAYFNSCINPMVYGFMSKNFRESFYKALCRCWRRDAVSKRQPSVSQTRTTSVRCHAMTSLAPTNGQRSVWPSWRNDCNPSEGEGETVMLS